MSKYASLFTFDYGSSWPNTNYWTDDRLSAFLGGVSSHHVQNFYSSYSFMMQTFMNLVFRNRLFVQKEQQKGIFLWTLYF
jgi:hypothetical protein